MYGRVSIHAPAWGATQRHGGTTTPTQVSIHAPAWGATEALKAEETALYKKRKAVENKAERLKAYLAAQMTLCGLKELKAGLFKLRFQPTTPAISIIDALVVPEKFHRVKIEIDKLAIRDALKNGEEVPGIELQRGEALVIR